MKKLYSIGETAKIIGISTQTLRSYTNMNLVEPEEINAETGYRYYSFSQLHYLDRIKYLRSLGLPLKAIADILKDGKPHKMLECLQQKRADVTLQIQQLQEQIDDIDWYTSYFEQLDKIHLPTVPYIRQFPERYILYVDYRLKNPALKPLAQENKEYMEIEMMALKNAKPYDIHRQWGNCISFEEYLRREFSPLSYFLFLKRKPEKWDSSCMAVLPAGLYMCLWCEEKLQIDNELVGRFYTDHARPEYAIALEYENSFKNYSRCPYEYQSLILP